MKHTKGEWKAREVRAYNNELVYTRIDSDNKTLGFAGVYCDDKRKISINKAKANAKLIAAAPNLLEACLMIARHKKILCANLSVEENNLLQEAIKKATE